MNNAPLYGALYAGLLFFIFDLRYASPLIYLSGGILASSLIHLGEPVRKVHLLQRLPTVGLSESTPTTASTPARVSQKADYAPKSGLFGQPGGSIYEKPAGMQCLLSRPVVLLYYVIFRIPP